MLQVNKHAPRNVGKFNCPVKQLMELDEHNLQVKQYMGSFLLPNQTSKEELRQKKKKKEVIFLVQQFHTT